MPDIQPPDLMARAEIHTYHTPDIGTRYAVFWDGEFIDNFPSEAAALAAIRTEWKSWTEA